VKRDREERKPVNITLTSEIEQALTEQAQREGTTPERLALEYLRERLVPLTPVAPPADGEETLADFLAEHIGVLSSSEHRPGGARMSADSGKQFAAGMVKKRQQGRL
jgi:hypothetical protein